MKRHREAERVGTGWAVNKQNRTEQSLTNGFASEFPIRITNSVSSASPQALMGRLLLVSLAAATASAQSVASTLIDLDRLPLGTSGRHIVDRNGTKVQLKCVNWYGAHVRSAGG